MHVLRDADGKFIARARSRAAAHRVSRSGKHFGASVNRAGSRRAPEWSGKHLGVATRPYKVGQLVPLPLGYSEWERLGSYVVAVDGFPYPKYVVGPKPKSDALQHKTLGDFVLHVVEIETRPHGVAWGQIVWVNPKSRESRVPSLELNRAGEVTSTYVQRGDPAERRARLMRGYAEDLARAEAAKRAGYKFGMHGGSIDDDIIRLRRAVASLA